MATGIVNHIALSVTDKQASADFYAPILEFLGYQRRSKYLWRRPDCIGDFILYKTKQKYQQQPHHKGQTGIHHLAFNSDTKEEVDEFYELLLKVGAKVLNAPATYTYSRGYYAVFFEDLDGIKLELAYTPNQKV
ncbi:MAG: VOC family protein [Arenicellales bacterium]|nr:VOC family protein [Arenicellales bacterium]